MSESRVDRVRRVLSGVVRQAVEDAHVERVEVLGDDAAATFVRDICTALLGANGIGPGGLRLAGDNKTALLLGSAPAADILLLGDLYYSQVVELIGAGAVSAEHAALAQACGGGQALDDALFRLYDRRQSWNAAVASLPVAARDTLKNALESARFRRARLGLVPKLGGRTLGIDLYA